MNHMAELDRTAAGHTGGTARRTVLVAAGETVFRTNLCAVLNALGRYEVVAQASTAWEATRRLQAVEPHIAVIDLSLARMIGLRADRLGGSLRRPPKVVLLTDEIRHEVLDEALEAGALGFATKNLDAALLDALLSHVLSDGCAIAPEFVDGFMTGPRSTSERFSHVHPRVSLLNQSERDVLRLLGYGLANTEIAAELHLSLASVKTYVSRLLNKLQLSNRTQAALVAHEMYVTERLVDPRWPTRHRDTLDTR
ncbi:LuxR C-terminal-related transcriptional regulator [Streptomyces sp. NPDC052040]|uniref:LuxR C-terminal-related transcriptional regulator n=1 Tax=unclassified Streptomyces TaxID=2593676 RepID=UPI0037D54BFF